MQMLYNSDSYVVVQFDMPTVDEPSPGSADVTAISAATPSTPAAFGRGGFEIVDKFARKEIFIEGALAERFRLGVEAITARHPQGGSLEVLGEALDEHIAGFTELAQNPVVLH